MRGFVDRVRLREPRRAVAALVAVALVLRLAGLGVRVAHWDEGRVGYWILRTAATGHWDYRPIVHGPFVQHVTRWTIGLLGATDFAMRLPVALLGGALPATALLFRTRLRDRETVALAGVLACNPLLLYYSRFMRNDLPLAVFAFVTFGALLTAWDTDRSRYLHLAGVAFALALTTKENAVLYPLSWLGAGTLVLAGVTIDRHRQGERWLTWLRSGGAVVFDRLRRWWLTLLLVPIEMLVVIVFFYAPRSPAPDTGLWSAIADPGLLPAVVSEATIGSVTEFARWIGLAKKGAAYPYLLVHLLAVLAVAAAASVVFAVIATRWERRPLVIFCGWWALSGAVGYPFVTDMASMAPWLAVHVVIALAIPAAIGLVAVVDRYRAARVDDRQWIAVGTAALLVCAGAFVASSAAFTTYQQPPHGLNVVAQGAQPGGDLKPVIEDIRTAASDAQRPDVLYYGDLAVANESHNDRPPAAGAWYHRLPLPWYTEAAGARVTSVATVDALPADPPPIVIANSTYRDELEAELPGYSVREEAIWLRAEDVTIGAFGVEKHLGGKTYVFFLDRSALTAAETGR